MRPLFDLLGCTVPASTHKLNAVHVFRRVSVWKNYRVTPKNVSHYRIIKKIVLNHNKAWKRN